MRVIKSTYADIDLPSIDLLSLLFDSKYCKAEETTEIHVEATNPSNSITKAGARDLVKRIAYALRHHYGIGANGPGKDVVLCTSSGNPLIPIVLYAIIAAGGVYSGASTAFTVGELTRQAKAGNAELCICSEDLLDKTVQTARASGMPQRNVLVLDYKTPGRWCLRQHGRSQAVLPSRLDAPMLDWTRITSKQLLEDTMICLLYSSGTTGLPKGVRLSHTNCVSAAICYGAFGDYARQRRKTPFEYRTIAHLPMAHIAGVQNFSITPFFEGGTTYWMPKFEFKTFVDCIKRCNITYQFTVPPIWLQIAKSPLVTQQFDQLEVAVTGAAPLGPELAAEVSARIGRGKIFLGQTWGSTETTGSMTGQPWHIPDRTGSVGLIMPNVDARVIDDDGNDVEDGQPGEMLIRGPVVTKGYHNNEQATKDSFIDDFYCTGDIGIHKNGNIYIVDRKKELIKYKGLQVAPAELEALLVSHPKIEDAAVIGVESRYWQTEVPKAYVVVKNDLGDVVVTAAEIQEYVKTNLSQHKQLRGGVEFMDQIPKSPSGKILRKELRVLAAAAEKATAAEMATATAGRKAKL